LPRELKKPGICMALYSLLRRWKKQPTGTAGHISIIALAAVLTCTSAHSTEPEQITAQEAYHQLRSTGLLSSVTIIGGVDLSKLSDASPAFETFQINNVRFKGPVRLIGSGFQRSLRIEGALFEDTVLFEACILPSLILRNSVWSAPLTVRGCEIQGISRFDGNRYDSDARFHKVKFRRRASFGDSTFRGRVEFLASEFGIDDPPRKATSFSDVIFEGPALFNNTIFHSAVKFQASAFEQDASFLNVQMRSGVSFRNVHFKGDAEFRFCNIGRADFGNRDNLTLFAERADFRGCKFSSAQFEFTEFRGETSFVNARFGAAGATFSNANLGNIFTDFGGVHSEGPLILSDAYFPALQLYWRELGSALLAAKPDAKVLAALHARLKAVGDTAGALDASYYLAHQRFTEDVSTKLPSLLKDIPAFLDAAGQRLVHYGEWLIWGWPTGYGTKLGRITLIALTCWLISAIAVAAGGRLLARVTPPADSESNPPKGYEPLPLEELPEGREPEFPASWAARLYLALGFTFRLLFKVGADNIRYITRDPNIASHTRWQTGFRILWHFGSGLLLLLTLTLANSSPMISRLIGELVP